ncbi:MAG: DUF1295 domain-containing protein [Planctomycetota bacterium]
MFEQLLQNLAVLAGLMFLLWMVSVAIKDASIVDPFWGFGFVVLAWQALLSQSEHPPRALLLVALTTLWGARLALFLLWRKVGEEEDYRYQAMRLHHGRRFPLVSLYTVFGLQCVILWFVAFPVQVGIANATADPLNFVDGLGFILWGIGLIFETVGDWQLARFKSDPANHGKVLDRGLWSLTRHPNYFGDFCVWWGIYLVSFQAGAWWTILSPLAMSFLLLKVSGVALMEKTIRTRRPDYQRYVEETNAFFPGPKRKQV